jgi:hypothetical protein
VYLAKKEYDELLSSEFGLIENKLENTPYKTRIMNRIKGAYNMGANEQMDFFFEEIHLPIRSVERDAIKERNQMAHGKTMNDKVNENAINLTHAYQTLFHRVLLKVLEYDGEYIGYCDPSDYLGVAEIKVNGTKIKALVF